MRVLRTPDERYAGLPGWPYAPRYLERDGLRQHYVDEGPRDAAVTALCLHGQPTWGYLYRRMIPMFTAAGLRVVAPDFLGFGRSDKPVDDDWYSFDRHRDTMLRLVEALDLKNVLLVVQDWGGLIGLTLPMAMPERFTRLLVMNTGLGTGTVTEGFLKWRAYANTQPDLAVGRLIQRGTPHLTDAEVAAYDAPFPDESYKVGARVFPSLVPINPEMEGSADNRAAWEVLMGFRGPCLTLFSDSDPITAGGARPFQKLIPGAKHQPHVTIENAGHFVQEDASPALVAALIPWLETL